MSVHNIHDSCAPNSKEFPKNIAVRDSVQNNVIIHQCNYGKKLGSES